MHTEEKWDKRAKVGVTANLSEFHYCLKKRNSVYRAGCQLDIDPIMMMFVVGRTRSFWDKIQESRSEREYKARMR